MGFQHKPNRGSLFKNDRKEKETHPDYKGDALIDGVDYWISAWVNDGKNGKYFSFTFQKKDEAHSQGVQQAQQAAISTPTEQDFDDIPF